MKRGRKMQCGLKSRRRETQAAARANASAHTKAGAEPSAWLSMMSKAGSSGSFLGSHSQTGTHD